MNNPASSTSPNPISQNYTCGICNKVYERRDLRDRHRRRCQISSKTPRVSKRKSCVACVASKQKCDLVSAGCGRCVAHAITCVYPPTARASTLPENVPDSKPSTSQPNAPDMNASWANQTSQDVMAFQSFQGKDHRQLPIQGTFQQENDYKPYRNSYQEQDMWRPPAVDAADMAFYPSQQLSANQYGERESGFSLLDLIGIPGNIPLANPNHQSQHDTMSSPPAPVQNLMYTDYRHQRNPAIRSSNHAYEAPSPMMSTPLAAGVFLPGPTSLSGDQTSSAPTSFAGESYSANRVSPDSSRFDDDVEVVAAIGRYLRGYVSKDFIHPFIHNTLYAIAQGDVLEEIATARCCLGAYDQITKNSAEFVYGMVDSAAGKVVSKFHLASASYMSALASIHAMCAYQGMGLFGKFKNMDSSGLRRAELHQSFFIKMTRHIFQFLPQPHSEMPPESWANWRLSETLRRTIFMVNIINELSRRVEGLGPSFFEPLDDLLIFDLQMPSPENMWTASSQSEWDSAKASAGLAATPKSLRQLMDDIGHVNEHELDEFTRIIVFCARHRPTG